jgi:two-component system, NarL family, nitrate/nitrite response regulator NarL
MFPILNSAAAMATFKEPRSLTSSPDEDGVKRASTFLFVSDVRLYCEALAVSLNSVAGLSFVGHCGVAEALDWLAETNVDVALIDTSAAEGLAIARPIRALFPQIRTLGMALSGDPERVLECAEAGFSGCVPFDAGIEQLATIIAGTARGELSCSPRVAGRLFERLSAMSVGEAPRSAPPPSDPVRTPLPQREVEIANLIRAGLTNKEIALELKISAATVKNHVHNLLEKLAAPRRAAISTQINSLDIS